MNTRYRGNSTHINQRNPISSKSKTKNIEPLFNNIITQVHKDQTHSNTNNIHINNIKLNNNNTQYKPHSLSPSKMLNPLHLHLLPPKPPSSSLKTLVLDLDETLVHSGFTPFDIPSDVVIQIEIDNNIVDIHVLVRPGVKEFLEKMSTLYEVIIFTASLSKYADPLLDILDEHCYCKYRLFREHCTLINGAFIKDLKRLGRELKDIIIVDNSPISYALHNENGLPVESWYDDKNDKVLYDIIPLLEFLAEVNDVREHICKMVIDNEIYFDKAKSHIKTYWNILKLKKVNGAKDKEKEGKGQQINIKIINNHITNYICSSNDDKCKEKDEDNIKCDNNNKLISNKSSSKYEHKQLNINVSSSKRDINTFRNTLFTNISTKPSHKKVDSYQGVSTFTRKNNFLKSSYISPTKPSPLTNINTSNKLSIPNITLLKTSHSKQQSNPIKSLKYISNTRPLTSTTSNINKSSSNFFPSSCINTNIKHTKSLSLNFDIPLRPKTSKKQITTDTFTKRKHSNEIKIDFNDILNRKSVSRSSRTNEIQNVYKYNTHNNNYSYGNTNMKYINKIIK